MAVIGRASGYPVILLNPGFLTNIGGLLLSAMAINLSMLTIEILLKGLR